MQANYHEKQEFFTVGALSGKLWECLGNFERIWVGSWLVCRVPGAGDKTECLAKKRVLLVGWLFGCFFERGWEVLRGAVTGMQDVTLPTTKQGHLLSKSLITSQKISKSSMSNTCSTSGNAFASAQPPYQYKLKKICKSNGCCRGAMVIFNSSGKNFIGRELPQ